MKLVKLIVNCKAKDLKEEIKKAVDRSQLL
jgi:hypothetical protein